jgi:predicted nucleotidyltransferase
MTKQEILDYLKSNQQYFYDIFGVKFIGLFGSYARGEADDNSDIDILYKIEKDKKLSMFQYLRLMKQLEEKLNKKIDLVREEKLKPQIKSHIIRDICYV